MQKYAKIASHIVMSGDLNAGHSLFGGLLVQWVDEAASIFVMKLLETRNVATKKISEIIYDEPTHLGDVLEIYMCVKAVGTTSITISCVVQAKKIEVHEKNRIILNCSLVFVKLNTLGRPDAHHFRIENAAHEEQFTLDSNS